MCIETNSTHKKIAKQPVERAQQPLERIHIDLSSPGVMSIQGNTFILTISDSRTRVWWVKFLKLKSDSLKKFKEFTVALEALAE